MVPWDHQSLHPKRHVDQFSRFCTAHCTQCHYCTMGRYVPPKNSLSLGDRFPNVTHGNQGSPELLTQTASRSVQQFSYRSQMLCCTMHCQLGRNPQNCPFPLGFRHPAGGGPSHGDRQHAQRMVKIARVVRDICLDPHLIHVSVGPPESSSKTASRWVQPFLHSTP